MRRAWVIGLVLLPLAALAERKWREKLNCTVIENPANDGDSFHVKWNTRKYLFRLLFVDTCESDTSLPDRLAEQAAYFGITPQDALKAGKMASKFTAEWLRKGPFTAYTQFDDARGRSGMDRDYAIITRGNEDLAIELVRNGLARIHGKQEVPSDMASLSTIQQRLKKAEMEAKQNRAGAWSFVPQATPFGTPTITERNLTISRTVAVYSLVEPGRVLGHLTPGMEITVLKAESPTMVRVRFKTSSGQLFEAQCRRFDLGL